MSPRLLVVYYLVCGGIIMGYLVASLFFIRFWRQTRDRLFLVFSVAFFLLGTQRAALAIDRTLVEAHTSLYLLRLFAFVLILGAIVDKNRGGRSIGG